MKNTLFLFIILICISGCFNKTEPSIVIATIGPKVYSVDDINERISTLDPQLQEFFVKKENKVRLLEQIVEEEIIYQLAKKERLQRSKDFKEKMEELKRQALINFFIQEKVEELSNISKEEVETYYNSNSNQFDAYETRDLSHILVRTEQEAKNILTRLKKGETFEALAEKHSIDPSKAQGGKLGWVRSSQLVEAFSDAAFMLTKRDPISPIVKTQFGFHIIKFNDSKTMPKQSLDSVFDSIRNELVAEKKRSRFKTIIENGRESFNPVINIENL
jgi:peptidyl-prolyl cis-trans isomerase C